MFFALLPDSAKPDNTNGADPPENNEDAAPPAAKRPRDSTPPTPSRRPSTPPGISLDQLPKFPFEPGCFPPFQFPPLPPSSRSSDKDRLLDLVTSGAALAAAAEFNKNRPRRSPSPQGNRQEENKGGMSATALASVQAALAALQAGQMSLNQVFSLQWVKSSCRQSFGGQCFAASHYYVCAALMKERA